MGDQHLSISLAFSYLKSLYRYTYIYLVTSHVCIYIYDLPTLYLSHVLNPCVHVKQGAPCKGVA